MSQAQSLTSLGNLFVKIAQEVVVPHIVDERPTNMFRKAVSDSQATQDGQAPKRASIFDALDSKTVSQACTFHHDYSHNPSPNTPTPP